MAIYADGPDGKPLAFDSEAEHEAYLQALRDAEPAWLQRLRQRRSEVQEIHAMVGKALLERRGRAAAFSDIAHRLRALDGDMSRDIDMAAKLVRTARAYSANADDTLKGEPT